MSVYRLKIAELERDLPLCRVTDDLYIAAFILFGDVEATRVCARELLKKAPEYDVMVTPECKGIPLVYEMARQTGRNHYIVARKGPKLYMTNVISTEVKSITTQSKQKLYIGSEDADAMRGKKVLLIDDVISTGDSIAALEELITCSGGIISGKMAVLAEGAAIKRDDIIYLEELPLFNSKGEALQV